MRAGLRQRLEKIESSSIDWISRLPTIDYLGMSDYDDGDWEEVHHDQTITVYRNRESREVRGVYADRRSDKEILSEGGNLEFL